MTDIIYLTFNDLKEDAQLEIYDVAKDEVFKIIREEFIDNYSEYIDDTHIEDIDNLVTAIIKTNKNLNKETKEEDTEDYKSEFVQIDRLAFNTFDESKIRNDLEELINEKASNMIYRFNYVFNQ